MASVLAPTADGRLCNDRAVDLNAQKKISETDVQMYI